MVINAPTTPLLLSKMAKLAMLGEQLLHIDGCWVWPGMAQNSMCTLKLDRLIKEPQENMTKKPSPPRKSQTATNNKIGSSKNKQFRHGSFTADDLNWSLDTDIC